MVVVNVKQNEGDVNFVQDSQHVVINAAAKKGDENAYTIAYEGIPADGLIISKNKYGDRTFFQTTGLIVHITGYPVMIILLIKLQ